jgi:hypothetical protein
MRALSLLGRIDSGRPQLELRNEGPEPVRVTNVALQRIGGRDVVSILLARGGNDYGRGSLLMFPSKLTISPGDSWRPASESLERALRATVASTEEVVIRIHLDLDPPERECDHVAPSFFVVGAQNGEFVEFSSLQGSLQGQPSMLDALLEDRRHGM